MVEVPGLSEVCQAFMVHENLDGKQGTLEIMPPVAQLADDRK